MPPDRAAADEGVWRHRPRAAVARPQRRLAGFSHRLCEIHAGVRCRRGPAGAAVARVDYGAGHGGEKRRRRSPAALRSTLRTKITVTVHPLSNLISYKPPPVGVTTLPLC